MLPSFTPEFVYALFYLCGILLAIQAVFQTRTPQGSIAWAVFLITFPFVGVPLYLIFGRNRFVAYAEALRALKVFTPAELDTVRRDTQPLFRSLPAEAQAAERVFEKLSIIEFTSNNNAKLLIDGEATFGAIFDAIERAESYVLVQFYIVRHDHLGNLLKERLIAKARQGVRVYFLFDGLGSISLSDAYVQELRAGGVEISSFRASPKRTRRYQLNFRNHRKIVVVDGKVGFVGGQNVGDEYLNRHPYLQPWRDTQIQIEGPSVLGLQYLFLADWAWSTDEKIAMNWVPHRAADGADMMVLPLGTGPSSDFEGCTLMFLQLINMARERVWIASPYFVPDEAILAALQLAAARGVDVRILIPSKSDNYLVYLAAFSYTGEIAASGIKLFRYRSGFLHQKVVLVDDDWSAVGTANFDNRSFRLNFEVTALVFDKRFAATVHEMLEQDFSLAKPVHREEYTRRNIVFRLGVRIARLMAPIL